MTECGALFGSSEFSIEPQDHHGCVLPYGHDNVKPHEFVDPDGVHWLWETDLECDCDHCMQCEGDYCTIYWRKQHENH